MAGPRKIKPPGAAKAPGDGVGHGKPPKDTRFKPGKSGNPNGRPKFQRPHKLVLDHALNRMVTLVIEGKKRRMTVFEAMVLRILQEAINGDAKARRDLLKLAKDFDYQPPPVEFGTMLEAWVATEGELPDVGTRWIWGTERIGEALRVAGLILAGNEGSVGITDALWNALLNIRMSAATRRKLASALKRFRVPKDQQPRPPAALGPL